MALRVIQRLQTVENHSTIGFTSWQFSKQRTISQGGKISKSESPDLIFFTGDLVNNYPSEASPYVDILSQLTAKYGKFAVLGNHDYSDYIGLDTTSPEGQKKWNDNLNEIKDIFKTSGFDLLLNEHRTLSVSGVEINVVGVENWGEGRFSKYGDLDKAMANTKKKCSDLFTFSRSHSLASQSTITSTTYRLANGWPYSWYAVWNRGRSI